MTNKVKGYRNMLNLSQKEMAKLLDMSTLSYHNKEKGKYEFKDAEKIKFKRMLEPHFPNITLEDIFLSDRK